MSSKAWLAGLSIALLSLGATAQEPDEEERSVEPQHQIKVLQHPYDIASFYRSSHSSEGSGYFGYQSNDEFSGRYPIANYYRAGGASSNPRGYGRFWNSPVRQRETIWISPASYRRRSFGHRGELFLFAPTFLAPVVPLNRRTFER